MKALDSQAFKSKTKRKFNGSLPSDNLTLENSRKNESPHLAKKIKKSSNSKTTKQVTDPPLLKHPYVKNKRSSKINHHLIKG